MDNNEWSESERRASVLLIDLDHNPTPELMRQIEAFTAESEENAATWKRLQSAWDRASILSRVRKIQ